MARASPSSGARDGEGGDWRWSTPDTEVVITDLKLPGTASGLDVLREVRGKNPRTEVVLMTGHGSIDSAVAAMREGAYHYVTKPVNPDGFDPDPHVNSSSAVASRRRSRSCASSSMSTTASRTLIGRSAAMRKVFQVIRQVAPARTTVLDHRRKRHWQGAGCPRSAPEQPAPG